MKKFILLLLLIAGITVPGLRAQSIVGTVDIKQVSVDKSGNILPDKNKISGNVTTEDFYSLAGEYPHIAALLNLSALGSQAAIISEIGNQNTAGITQTGGDNSGAIYIIGNNNKTSLSQVENDFSVLDVMGNNNHFNINQTVAGVKNYIRLNNANGIHMNAVQNSSGLILQQMGGNGVPLQIKITGQNIPVEITNY